MHLGARTWSRGPRTFERLPACEIRIPSEGSNFKYLVPASPHVLSLGALRSGNLVGVEIEEPWEHTLDEDGCSMAR